MSPRVPCSWTGWLAMLALLVASSSCSTPDARPASRAGVGVLGRYEGAPPAAWMLPRALREVSGVAVIEDGRVFAHNDEQAVIYELDPRARRVVKSFALGDGRKPLRGDFEGLAIANGRFFLITSTGRLYETREGEDHATLRYDAFDTGFGTKCELEGLAYEPSDRSLIIGCKRPYDPALQGFVTLFRWSIDRREPATPSRISIPVVEVVRGTDMKAFHPSAVERDSGTGHYVIVAGPQRAITELTPAGAVVATRLLHPRVHPQPEGITFLGDSAMMISDEGGAHRASLTLYRRVHQ